jgi:hypothetical protein
MNKFNNKISNLVDQISQVDNMILLHQGNNDEMMVQQYQVRKMDYLKELVSELIHLNESNPRIHEIVKTIITKIDAMTPIVDEREISRQFRFSLTELEEVIDAY